MSNVSIDDMAEAIAETLETYAEDVSDELHEAVKQTTKECVQDIKDKAPKDTGAYKKAWTSKVQFEKHDDIRTVVYAKAPEYRKTHLLENGHAKVGGGRVQGFPHIAPAEQKAEEKLVNRVKVGISRL